MSDEREQEPGAPEPFGLRNAIHLTLLAWLASFLVLAALLGWASFPVAIAIGTAVGYGGLGTLGARQVPAPAELRLGLRGMSPRFLGILALLTPAVILVSELDNWVALALPRPDPPGAEGADPPATDEAAAGLILIEAFVASVLLRPVVEEFFFRGVIQQGLVERFGNARGIAWTALLFATTSASIALPAGTSYFLSLEVQGLCLGALYGLVRLASGSLLAPIGLHVATNGLGILAVANAERWPIPGFNAPGASTPGEWLVPCAAAVALGVTLALRALREAEPLPPSDGPGASAGA